MLRCVSFNLQPVVIFSYFSTNIFREQHVSGRDFKPHHQYENRYRIGHK